jgi:hypothetical protein
MVACLFMIIGTSRHEPHAGVPLGEYITDEMRRVLLAGGTVDRARWSSRTLGPGLPR